LHPEVAANQGKDFEDIARNFDSEGDVLYALACPFLPFEGKSIAVALNFRDS
jgi:hypothetical protein